MNQYHKDYLKFKTLAHRFESPAELSVEQGISLFTDFLRKPDDTDFTSEEIEHLLQLQNVCAKIPVHLVKQLEATIEVISMSKREFIEIAIISAIEETHRIFAENSVAIPEIDMPEVSQ